MKFIGIETVFYIIPIASYALDEVFLMDDEVIDYSLPDSAYNKSENITQDLPETSPFIGDLWNWGVFAGFRLFIITWLAQFMLGFLIFCYILCDSPFLSC